MNKPYRFSLDLNVLNWIKLAICNKIDKHACKGIPNFWGPERHFNLKMVLKMHHCIKIPPNSLTFMCMTWISQKYPSDLKIGEMWLEERLDVRICTLSAVVKVIIWQKIRILGYVNTKTDSFRILAKFISGTKTSIQIPTKSVPLRGSKGWMVFW